MRRQLAMGAALAVLASPAWADFCQIDYATGILDCNVINEMRASQGLPPIAAGGGGGGGGGAAPPGQSAIWDGGGVGESTLGFAAASAAAFAAVTGSYAMGVAAGVLGVAAMGAGAIGDAADSGAVGDAAAASAAEGGGF